MTQQRHEERTCDRCGAADLRPSARGFAEWGIMCAKPVNGPFGERIGFGDADRQYVDLCPGCFRQLLLWWRPPPAPMTEGSPS